MVEASLDGWREYIRAFLAAGATRQELRRAFSANEKIAA